MVLKKEAGIDDMVEEQSSIDDSAKGRGRH